MSRQIQNPRSWCFVYGLFSIGKRVCLYVGMSRHPIARFQTHIHRRTTKGVPFEFTILKRVAARYGQREEARAIQYYKSIGQAKLNRSDCKMSLNRTILNDQAIAFVRDVKDGAARRVTDSDHRIILTTASYMRSLKIRNVRFESFPRAGGFKIIARVSEVTN